MFRFFSRANLKIREFEKSREIWAGNKYFHFSKLREFSSETVVKNCKIFKSIKIEVKTEL